MMQLLFETQKCEGIKKCAFEKLSTKEVKIKKLQAGIKFTHFGSYLPKHSDGKN
jgi:hypothetical protein